MRNSRQITVLRSLFKTLHPILESGLAPARRLLTGTQEQTPEPDEAQPNRATRTQPPAQPATQPATIGTRATSEPIAAPAARRKPMQAALERTLTDEHLVVELENITRQMSQHGHTANTQPSRRASPQRGQRRHRRDTLLALLEDAKVRIQVLETELELARGFDETIPLLTEEWPDDTPDQQD